MNNIEVAHIWANGQKASGKGSNLFFEGDTIYSYGRHFPIARRVVMGNGDVHYIVNPARYSVSTSKHQTYVRGAIAGDCPRYYVNPNLVNWDELTDIEALNAANEKQRQADIISGEEAKAEKRAAAKLRREQAKAKQAAIDNFPFDLKAWKDGGKLPDYLRQTGAIMGGTYLRINGTDIETTRGARVPVSVCRKVWPILKVAADKEKAEESAQAWVPFFSAPDFKWGNYVGVSMRRVAKSSPISVKVGCHEFNFSEVEDIAERLNLV